MPQLAMTPEARPPSPPVALTVAGSDCSAGAGIQADLKAFTAQGCYGVTVLTAVVAEIPAHVSRIALLDPAMIEDQLRVLGPALPIRAVKTGMLGGRDQIEAVLRGLEAGLSRDIPLVVDPVMISTSGRRLLGEDAMELLTTALFRRAILITPNMDEAGALLGTVIQDRSQMEAAAWRLHERHGTGVLLKGGHLAGRESPDALLVEGKLEWLEGQRVPGVKTHGTGCTYSAAITAGLARGMPLREAVATAKAYVTASIARHFRWGEVDALYHHASTRSVAE